MMRSSAFRALAAAGVAVLLVAGGASAAVADQLVIDGDGITPFDPSAASVEACTDKPVQFTLLLAALRQGQSASKNFKSDTDVTVAFRSAGAGMTATLSDAVIHVPLGWEQVDNSPPTAGTDLISAVVTLPAQAAAGSSTIVFGYSGTNVSGGAIAPGPDNTSSVTVSWTTKKCVVSTDSVAPTLTLPATIIAEATSAAGAVVTFQTTATDETAPAAPPVTCSHSSGSTFPIATTTVSCSAQDAAGNKRDGTFDVVVRDTTKPVVDPVSAVSLEATGAGTTAGWINPAANDTVSGALATTCSPASGSSFPVGPTTVTCTATDAAGNTGSSTFTVTISDTTAPSLTVPGDIVREATGPAGNVVTFTASASDLVDGPVDVTCEPASGSTFPIAATTVACTATDAQGNKASGSFSVTIEDTTAPDITVPAPAPAEATGPGGAVVTFDAPTATDIVDPSVVVECDHESGDTFPLGATKVTCTAEDAAGNEASESFTVTVVDTTPPTIDVPETVIVEAEGPDGAIATYSVSATDLVDGAVDAQCSPASGALFALGATQVDCTAVDEAGNEAEPKSFGVFVEDSTAPVFSPLSDVVAEATGPAGAAVTYGPITATDAVDQDVDIECTPASGATFALGDTMVDCTATDDWDNVGTGSFTVTVRDTTPPTITWTGGPDEGAHYVFGSTIPTPSCEATDLVKGVVACTVDGFSTAVGTHQLIAKATDGTNPATSGPRTYTVDPWTKTGFFQPVDMGGVLNTVKAGSTVPLKFELFAGSAELTNVSAVKGFAVKSIACPSASTAADEIEFVTSGQTVLRYDTTAGQFIQNWQTPKSGAGGCYRVTMTAADQVTTIVADFKLK